MPVDSNGLSLFNLSWITGTLNFNLISPTGQVITPGYAQANPSLVLYSSAPITSPFGAIASYGFTTTTPGLWTLQVSNPGPISPVDYRAQVSFESPLTVTALLDKEIYSVGSTVQMTAAISSSVPITGLQAAALIHLPNGATNAISLTVVNPQTLAATYVVPATSAGYVLVQVQISGFANGTPFAREADTEFLIPTNGAKLAGVYTDRPTDSVGVLYRTLSFDSRISVTTPATYTLSADLMAGSQIIAHSQTQGLLSSGTPTVTIKFSGDAIRASQLNGPYVVSNVVLVDSSSYSLLADSANSVWTTTAYSYTQFGTPTLYLPLILKNP